MTDYKKLAEAMLAMPSERKTYTKKDFEKLCKIRNFQFVQKIEGFENGEVWGNSNFQVLVINNNNSYKII